MSAAKVCDEGDIRLVDGIVSYEGRIEYCRDNAWGTVCDRGWTEVDAAVACYQLGYPRESKEMLHALLCALAMPNRVTLQMQVLWLFQLLRLDKVVVK